MNIPEVYDYLVRARRDLWAALEGVLDEVSDRALKTSVTRATSSACGWVDTRWCSINIFYYPNNRI